MANVVEIIIDGNNKLAIQALDGVKTKMAETENSVKSFSSSFKGFSAIGSSIQSMLAPLAATASIAGIVNLVKNSIELEDQMGKTAQKVGTTTENLSTLSYAAKLADVDSESLTKGLERLSRNMFDVSTGTGSLVKAAFNTLGISAVDANGKLKDSSIMLLDVADKFSKMKDGSEKTAIAMKLFGRSGAEMIPLLNQGSAAIKSMQEEADKLGLSISEQNAHDAEIFMDNMKRMKEMVTGVGLSLANQLLPALDSISNSMVVFAKDQDTVNIVGQGLGMALKLLATAFILVGSGITVAGEALGTLGAAFVKFSLGDYGGAADIISSGFAKIKETSLTAGNAIKALYGSTENYQNLTKKFGTDPGIDTHTAKVKQLEAQWQKVADTLNNKVTVLGMGSLVKAQFDLNNEVQGLLLQYQGAPAKLQVILNYYDKMLAKQAMLATQKILPKGLDTPANDNITMSPKDITALKAQNDLQIKMSSQVTSVELANKALMLQGTQDTFNGMAGAADNFYQMSGQKSKEAFALYKAFSIAQSAIATYDSAIKAYDSMVGIPFVGPALAVAAAAAAVAFGVSNMAQIASMQPGGSATSISGSAVSPSLSVPSSTASTTNNTNSNNSRNLSVTVNVQGSLVGNEGQWVRDVLVPELNKAYGDGVS